MDRIARNSTTASLALALMTLLGGCGPEAPSTPPSPPAATTPPQAEVQPADAAQPDPKLAAPGSAGSALGGTASGNTTDPRPSGAGGAGPTGTHAEPSGGDASPRDTTKSAPDPTSATKTPKS